MEKSLGPVSVICSLPPFFRKKNVSFDKNFGTCLTVFPLFITAMAHLSSTRVPGLVSSTKQEFLNPLKNHSLEPLKKFSMQCNAITEKHSNGYSNV